MNWVKKAALPFIAFGLCLLGSALLIYYTKAQTQVSLTPNPTSLVFTAPIGKTSAPQTFTITNTTSIPQTLTSITVAGSDWYKIVGGTCVSMFQSKTPLPPTQNCTIQVTFSMPASPPTNFQLKTAQGEINVPQTGNTHLAASGR